MLKSHLLPPLSHRTDCGLLEEVLCNEFPLFFMVGDQLLLLFSAMKLRPINLQMIGPSLALIKKALHQIVVR